MLCRHTDERYFVTFSSVFIKSFLLLTVKSILNNLCLCYISKASIRWLSPALMVHVSHLYKKIEKARERKHAELFRYDLSFCPSNCSWIGSLQSVLRSDSFFRTNNLTKYWIQVHKITYNFEVRLDDQPTQVYFHDKSPSLLSVMVIYHTLLNKIIH